MEKEVNEFDLRASIVSACGSLADCAQRAADGVDCDPNNFRRLDYTGTQLALALVIAEDAWEKLQVLADLINKRIEPESERYKRRDESRRLLPELTQDFRSERAKALIEAARRRE